MKHSRIRNRAHRGTRRKISLTKKKQVTKNEHAIISTSLRQEQWDAIEDVLQSANDLVSNEGSFVWDNPGRAHFFLDAVLAWRRSFAGTTEPSRPRSHACSASSS